MLFEVTFVFKKEGKNNHLRKRYIVLAEDEDNAISKVKRTIRCKRKTFLDGVVYELEKTKVAPYLI